MKKIQMVDLKGQYEKIKERIDSSVLDVIESYAFINGPEVKSFKKELEEYLDVKHVIPCSVHQFWLMLIPLHLILAQKLSDKLLLLKPKRSYLCIYLVKVPIWMLS